MRNAIKVAALGLCGIVLHSAWAPNAIAADSIIKLENANPGTTDWIIDSQNARCSGCLANVPASGTVIDADTNTTTTYSPDQFYGGVEIQGYASKPSVNLNESINLYVSIDTPELTNYTMKIFRIGWYGGAGGRLMLAPISLQAKRQAVPHTDPANPSNPLECNWSSPYPLQIPSSWVSGVYLAKLEVVLPRGPNQTPKTFQSYIFFVVRDDSRNASILYTTSDATYQAYNEWGGASLYTTDPLILTNQRKENISNYPADKNGWKVSYKRPYWRDNGAGEFLSYEINMVRWLESQGSSGSQQPDGYDISYATDADLHGNPDLLTNHKALLTVGHSEYWSWNMRANVERARERGVSLGFFAANTVYWQVRFEPSLSGEPNSTIVAYKEDAFGVNSNLSWRIDPFFSDGVVQNDLYITTNWTRSPVNRPEEALLGVQYAGISANAVQTMRTTDPASWPSWLSQGTGLSGQTDFPSLLGYEVDRHYSYFPIGIIDIANSTFFSDGGTYSAPSQATLYTAPSGANVFASGSIYWSRGLAFDASNQPVVPAVQAITGNFLNHSLQTPLVPASSRLAATISASAEAAGYPASNANDSSATTQWVANLQPTTDNNNAWIQLDFGSRKWIQRLKWNGAINSPYPASSPANYTIAISDDGVRWQAVVNRSYGARVPVGDELINEQARFIRMTTSQVNDGTGWSLSFFEFWAEGAPPPPSGRLPMLLSQGSSSASNYPDSNGNDLDASTQWVATLTPNVANNYASYQVDLGHRKQIDRVKWIGANGSPYPASSPTNYTIQVSDDGSTWNTVIIRTNANAVVNGDEPLSAQGRYVRLTTSKVNDGTGWALSLYEFWVEGSDASNVLAAVATSSSSADGYPAQYAVDNSPSTQWVANLTPTTDNNYSWIALDFGSSKQINRVRWNGADGAPYPAASPTYFYFETSDDGVNWDDNSRIWRRYPNEIVRGDEVIDRRTRYLRIVANKVNDGTGWALSFFDFWAEGY